MAELKLKTLILPSLALAALASLPTEFLNEAMHWDSLSPESYLAEIIWMPVEIYCGLRLLSLWGQAFGLKAGLDPRRVLASALGLELLTSLLFCKVALLWALPALLCLSVFGVATAAAKLGLALLVLGGAIPPCLWMLERLPAQAVILWQGLSASEALKESAALSRGKLKSALIPLLFWNLVAQGLEGLGLLADPVNWLVLPLSLIVCQAALAKAYRNLTL
jgi:hypothetical protein